MSEQQVLDCIKQLHKAIECSICLDELSNPVETRCGHTFCGKCLQTALSKKSVLPCPLCKYPIKKRGIKDALYLSSVVNSVKHIKTLYDSNFCRGQSSQLTAEHTCEKEATLDLLDIVDISENKEALLHSAVEESTPYNKTVNSSRNRQGTDVEKEKSNSEFENQKQKYSCQQPKLNVKQCKQKTANSKAKKSTATNQAENVQKENANLQPESSSKHKNRTLIGKKKKVSDKSSDLLDKSASPHKKQFSEITNQKRVTSKAERPNLKKKNNSKKRESLQKDDCADEDVTTKSEKENVQDKVANWLEHVHPSLQASEEENGQIENDDFHDSDFDDMVSASQQDAERNYLNMESRKRRHVISDAILNDIKEKSAKRDDEIFGAKSKQQYRPKHTVKDVKFYGVTSPDIEPATKLLKEEKQKTKLLTEDKQKTKKTKQKKKRRKSKNLFDLNGLSQGVSPFSSPCKDSELKPNDSQNAQNSCGADNNDSVETRLLNENSLQLSEQFQQPAGSPLNQTDSCQSSKQKINNAFTDTDIKSPSKRKNSQLDSHENADTPEQTSRQLPDCNVTTSQKKDNTSAHPASYENLSQDSKSTICSDEPKVTTVIATIHSQPKNNEKNEFKTPVVKKMCTKKLTTTSKSGYGLLRLEDMPIVCVAETQDDSGKLQSYFVETPAHSETTILSKLKPGENDPAKDNSTETDSRNRKPVELGILDFSEPSQLPQKIEQKKQAPVPISPVAKILGNISPTDVEELRTQEDEMEVTSRKRKNASKKSQIFSSDETKATKNKLPAPVENYKSKSQTPEKFNADNFSSRSQGAGVACDCVPSNVSSLETNIIENTEEIEVARFKPKLNCPTTRKGAAEKDKALKSKEGRTGKLDKSETTALTDSCQAGKSIGPDVRNTIESIATSPSPVKHKKSELPARPLRISSTWPETAQSEDSKLNSVTSCGLIQTVDNDYSFKLSHKSTKSVKIHCSEGNPPDGDSVSSSPLLFAQSQSQIRSAVGRFSPARHNAGVCDKCKHMETCDKYTQVEENRLTQQQVTPSPKTITTLCEKLKQICGKVENRSVEINERIESLQEFLMRTLISENSSNESRVKPSVRQRSRVLSSSGSDSDLSQVNNEEIIIPSGESDIEIEIENSLPDLKNKRNSNCTGTRRNAALTGEQQDLYISDGCEDVSSPNSCRKTSDCAEVPATNDSGDSDVILATLRTSGRRKRILSSDEESMTGSLPKKIFKSNSTSTKIPAHSTAFVDAQNAVESVLSERLNEVDEDNRSVYRKEIANESPPLTESQVPPPTPPPPYKMTSKKNILALDCLLNSISKLAERRQSDDAVADNQIINVQSNNVKTVDTSEKNLFEAADADTSNTVKSNNPEVEEKTDSSQVLSNVTLSNILVGESIHKTSSRKFGVMVSGLRGKGVGLVRLFAKKWGGEFYESFVAGKVTHAVVRTNNMRCDRTLKYLQAVASKAWVVSISWITHSLREKKLLPEDRFEVIGDNLEMSEVLSFGPKRSRLCPPERKLLSDYVIYCIPPFALFTQAQYVELLRLCGAIVVTRPDELSKYGKIKKKIITVDPDAYSDDLPNYAVT